MLLQMSEKSGHRMEIDAKPFPYRFVLHQTALIIIDMQRDFVEPGGFGESLGNDVTPLQAVIPTIKRLLHSCRSAGVTVIHTRECHAADLSDCPKAKQNRGNPKTRIGDIGPMGRILIDGEPGTEIIDSLAPLPNELVINKPGKGAFYQTDLQAELLSKGIHYLIFAGVTTEVCVQSTMREANDRGFECLLAEDATASYFPEFYRSTIEMIRAQGAIVGWTATTAEIEECLGRDQVNSNSEHA